MASEEWSTVTKKPKKKKEIPWEDEQERFLDVVDFAKTMHTKDALTLLGDGFRFHSVLKSTKTKKTTQARIDHHLKELSSDDEYRYLVIETSPYRDVIVFSKKIPSSSGMASLLLLR